MHNLVLGKYKIIHKRFLRKICLELFEKGFYHLLSFHSLLASCGVFFLSFFINCGKHTHTQTHTHADTHRVSCAITLALQRHTGAREWKCINPNLYSVHND